MTDETTGTTLVCYKCRQEAKGGENITSISECFAAKCSRAKCSRSVCLDCSTSFCESKNLCQLRGEEAGTEEETSSDFFSEAVNSPPIFLVMSAFHVSREEEFSSDFFSELTALRPCLFKKKKSKYRNIEVS